MKKTKLKLKENYKNIFIRVGIIVGLVISIILILCLVNKFSSVDYKLEKKGYTKEAISVFKEKLSSKHIDFLLDNDRIDYMDKFVNEEFYMDNKLDAYLEYFKKNSKRSFEDVISIVNIGANENWYSNIEESNKEDGSEILVNKYNCLGDDYNPGTIKKFSATYAYGDVYGEESAYTAFMNMSNAAKKDGILVAAVGGYRSHDKQAKSYDGIKEKEGLEYADMHSVRPGCSEYETGLSFDVYTGGLSSDKFRETKTYEWLHNHAHEFGFIERYPEGKSYLTGFDAKSSYFRYVGVKTAKRVIESNLTYDEYYVFYLKS